eukprot:c25530_g1_i3 orf=409-2625(-)
MLDMQQDSPVDPVGARVETDSAAVYRVQHGLTNVSRILVSWSRGNCLRLSYLQQSPPCALPDSQAQMSVPLLASGKVMEVRLGRSGVSVQSAPGLREQEEEAENRRLAFDSLPAFALLQSQRQMHFGPTGELGPSISSEWWEIVLEYSHRIGTILGSNSAHSTGRSLYKSTKEKHPTILKAVWELVEIFYVDKNTLLWLPERIVDWLESYDQVLPGTEQTSYSKVTELQVKVSKLQFPENDRDYWDGIASALSVGWLDVAVTILRMHGSYQHDQIDDRQTENGLVEAVAVLVSKMPRLRPSLPSYACGTAFNLKLDFAKAWEKWRSQVAKLNGSAFWADCTHQETVLGLKKLLQLLLGDIDILVCSSSHWMELVVAHFLYVRPFMMVSEGILGLARKCVQLKPVCDNDILAEIILAIMGENTEVVLAECARLFDSWMLTHLMELLTLKSSRSQTLLRDEKPSLGGISLEELHRLVYAQVLSSHTSTWQLAPAYLACCPKQGLGLLENLLFTQPVSRQYRLAFKVLEVCRTYELWEAAKIIMRVIGVHIWKHGRKGAGIVWLQQADDDMLLSAIADELLDMVTVESTPHGDRLQQCESLIDLLGSDVEGLGGLSFLHKYRDFKLALNNFREVQSKEKGNQKLATVGREAVDYLMQLMKPGVAPQRFWLALLYDSVELLECPEEVLVKVPETNILLARLQELSLVKVRGDADSWSKHLQPPNRVRLALGRNLGRAILKEC